MNMWDYIKNAILSSGILRTLVIGAVGVLIILIVMKIVCKVLERGRIEKAAHNLIRTLVKTVLWVLLGLILASSLGIDVTGIVALASVITLAISLALQNMLANVIGGFTLLNTHPFKAGDYVEIADQSGTVKDIGIAYTRLITPDNKIVSIPNSSVVADEIVNYTTTGTRRVEIKTSASYDCAIETVESALNEAARVDGVLDEPASFVSVIEYGDSAISYVVRVWTKTEDYWTVHFAIMHKIKEVFEKQGIAMTYPHINVHLDK